MEAFASLPSQQEKQENRLAVLYTRVSSTEQSVTGFSISAQQQLLREYARSRGFAIEVEFSEVESAGRTGRGAFGAMLEHLNKNRRIRAILVEKTDRLYRNIQDWLAVGELDVEVHLVKENVVLSENSVSSEKFLHGIKVLVAKNYSDNLSEEARKGMLEKARQGHWPTRAPHGYRNVMGSKGKKIIEPDPELGPQVLQIFRWYATGNIGIRQLTDMAVLCGMKDRRSRKPIQRTTINNILRNPLYMGEFDWGGKRFKGVHQPLVSAALWDDVQVLLAGRAPKHRVREKLVFTFTCLVSCGRCRDEGAERFLVAERQKGKYVYYRCERCKRNGRAEYVREEAIEAAFRDALPRR